jgi:UDPglucose 6-dehydrogenase
MMEKVSIIGIGRLGLCLALSLEHKGFNVVGCDISEEYISELNNKTFKSPEPRIEEFLSVSKNFKATSNLKECLLFSDHIFLMVATPSLPNGKYNHTQIESVIVKLKELGRQDKRKLLIVGCTTYPGYCETIVNELDELNYDVMYNPEFIAQGNIINGQLNPDLVLIGENDKNSGDILEGIHNKLCDNKPIINRMSLTEAELTKLSINCFITTKISFANMIGDLCNKLDISHNNVLRGVGSDSRIGSKYLNWGYGFGGPCFPRDNRALGILCEENHIEPTIPKASDNYNNLHINHQFNHVVKDIKNNEITIDGVSYKKDSILIEESQQLKLAVKLMENGFDVTVKDKPIVIEQVKNIYNTKFKYDERD